MFTDEISSINLIRLMLINSMPYNLIVIENMYGELIITPRGDLLVDDVDLFIGQHNQDICHCVIEAFDSIE